MSRGCLGVPQPRQCQPVARRGLWGFRDIHLTPSPLPQSVQDFHEDLFPDCAGTLPATGAQAWWAGDSRQVSVTWGVSSPVALPGAATAPCPPLCPPAGGEGEPAPCAETHGDLHLPHHRLHSAAGSRHRPHRHRRRPEREHGVAGECAGGAEASGGPRRPHLTGKGEGWDAGTPCPPILSPIGGQRLLLAILAGLAGQCRHLPLGQHRPLQRLRQQPQPEVAPEHFG